MRIDVDPAALMQQIRDDHLSDDEPLDKSGVHLLNAYNHGTEGIRTGIDYALIALTGWSMESLAKRARGEET